MFINGESCQDWAKRLLQNLNLPRKAEDVFSLAFCAWTQDCEDVTNTQLKLPSHASSAATAPTIATATAPASSFTPWWRQIATQDYPLTGEQLFRFEVQQFFVNNS